MALEAKEVKCNYCGNMNTIEETKNWCRGCGRPIFYDDKAQARQKWSIRYWYIIVALFLGTGFYVVKMIYQLYSS